MYVVASNFRILFYVDPCLLIIITYIYWVRFPKFIIIGHVRNIEYWHCDPSLQILGALHIFIVMFLGIY